MFQSAFVSIVFGRLVRDPEIRVIGNSDAAVVDVAINLKKKNDKKTIYAELTFWNKDAELITQYHKGDTLEIIGSTDISSYVNKNTGNAEAKLNISVISWRPAENKSSQGNGNSQQVQGQQPLQNNNGGYNNNRQNSQNGNYTQQNAQYQPQNTYGNNQPQQYSQPPVNQQAQYQQAPMPNNAPPVQQQYQSAPIPPQNIPPQDAVPQNVPPQRNNNNMPPIRGNQYNNQTEFYAQGGMPYANSPQTTPDGDLAF